MPVAGKCGIVDSVLTSLTAKPDTAYIQDLRGLFGIQMSFFQKNSAFSIADLLDLSSLNYANSDSSMSTSIGINYKWLSLKMGFSFGLFDRNRSGRKFDFSTQMHMPAITLSFAGNLYNGYYLKNTYPMLQGWAEGTRYERPDIRTNMLRVSADYYHNHTRYSRKALTSAGELQRRTAGSFVAGIMFNRNVVSGDSSFIPTAVNDSLFNYHSSMRHVRNIFVGADAGYALTIVTPVKVFVNMQFSLGFAYDRNLFQVDAASDRDFNSMNIFMQGIGNLGYNSDTWFLSISANLFAIEHALGDEGASINSRNTLFQATLAYRIKLERDYGVGELFKEKYKEWRARRKEQKG